MESSPLRLYRDQLRLHYSRSPRRGFDEAKEKEKENEKAIDWRDDLGYHVMRMSF